MASFLFDFLAGQSPYFVAQMATLKRNVETKRQDVPMKQPKNAVIRARCNVALKESVEDIARMQKIDPADVIRIACESYVNRIQAALRGQMPGLGQ